MIRVLLLLVSLALCWSVSPCLAEDEAQVLRRIQEAAAEVRTIQADFQQVKHLAVFQTDMLTKGRMLLEKPDKLRWEYLEPSASGFMVNGADAIRWNELVREPERFSIDDDMAAKIVAEQLLAWASVDLERLRGNFSITVEQAEPPVLRLLPRSEQLREFLEHIQISFAADARVVRQVVIQEKDGDDTKLYFENVRINEPLPENVFTIQ